LFWNFEEEYKKTKKEQENKKNKLTTVTKPTKSHMPPYSPMIIQKSSWKVVLGCCKRKKTLPTREYIACTCLLFFLIIFIFIKLLNRKFS
jgi:hypothetical protein